jgi:hypothetical protein
MHTKITATTDDLRTFAHPYSDLANPAVMDRAWDVDKLGADQRTYRPTESTPQSRRQLSVSPAASKSLRDALLVDRYA